ncbi:hypothetical protein GCM10011513_17300 [Franconibacter daqui]|uniref:hypothetical protein n=1 Tax=Franconibacter daqui TaxID=2047724 RepID=UPI00166F2E79|nr:hypothetical protein [Franconibacter daqui]GGD20313.1 hypothetical protein GCM10011513_17300 [Franconibacter daqui]
MSFKAFFLEESQYTYSQLPEKAINPFAERGVFRKRVLITHHNEPALILRIFVGTDEDGFLLEQCFSQLLLNSETLAILYGQHVHLFNLASHEVKSHFLDDYAGDLYPVPDSSSAWLSETFLATTFCYTFLISLDKGIIWRSAQCVIDGVVINDIREEVIYGSGEWDPPGGWRPFMLSMATGELINIGHMEQ